MKKKEILKERRELKSLAGKSEYLFFTSVLLSAAALCAIAVLAVDNLMRVPEVSEVYGSAVAPAGSISIPVSNALPDFLLAAASGLERGVQAAVLAAPSALVFVALLLFIVCPIYQGTVRWCAYLIEERRALPIGAVLFYFLSPRLYFSSVLISVRIFARKLLAGVAFLSAPAFCIGVSLLLGSEYLGQQALAAATLILSVVWLCLALILYFIFCERYSAVRYLFALGNSKKLFSVSKKITAERRAWFFTLRLRLWLNIFLALGIITAPAALSRIICGKCLAVRALLSEKKTPA